MMNRISIPSRADIKRWCIDQASKVVGGGLIASWGAYWIYDLDPLTEGMIWGLSAGVVTVKFLGPWIERKVSPDRDRFIQVLDTQGEKYHPPVQIPDDEWADLDVFGGTLSNPRRCSWGDVYLVLDYDKEAGRVVTNWEGVREPDELLGDRRNLEAAYNEWQKDKKENALLKRLFPDAVLEETADLEEHLRETLTAGALPHEAEGLESRLSDVLEDVSGDDQGDDQGDALEDVLPNKDLGNGKPDAGGSHGD